MTVERCLGATLIHAARKVKFSARAPRPSRAGHDLTPFWSVSAFAPHTGRCVSKTPEALDGTALSASAINFFHFWNCLPALGMVVFALHGCAAKSQVAPELSSTTN